MLDERIVKNIEKKLGLSIKQIKAMSPEKLREYIEKRSGEKVTIKSVPIHEWKTMEEIEEENDNILKWW